MLAFPLIVEKAEDSCLWVIVEGCKPKTDPGFKALTLFPISKRLCVY